MANLPNDQPPYFYGAHATAISPPYLALRAWDEQGRRVTQVIMRCDDDAESAAWAEKLNNLLHLSIPARVADSQSEYKLLKAQSADVKPPEPQS